MVQLADRITAVIGAYAEKDTINIIYNSERDRCEGLCFGKPFGDAVKRFGLEDTVSVYQTVMNRRFEQIMKGYRNFPCILIWAYANGKLRDWENSQVIRVLGENPLFDHGDGLSEKMIELRNKLGGKDSNLKITVPVEF
jgi:hypothetical protein